MPTSGNAEDASTRPKDDEYVAQLLAKDAREYSLRYSALGVYGTTPKRPTAGAPKPNTRFLKHILRETDTHNTNLKRKEEEEARQKAKRLLRQRLTSRDESVCERDERGRESKRRRVESPRDEERDRERRLTYRHTDIGQESDEKSSRRRLGESRKSKDRERKSSVERRKDSRRHRRHEDNDYERHKRGQSSRTSHERSSDKYKSYDREGRHRRPPEHEHRRNRAEGTITTDIKRHTQKRSPSIPSLDSDLDDARSAKSSDSDPLSNLIGPLPPSENDLHTPPALPRGRGAFRTKSSTIDSHFEKGYDPALDVHLDDEDDPPTKKSSRRPIPGMATEDDDWDMALEALRDRNAWRKRGAERLREAGFEKNVVERWENNTAFAGLNDMPASDFKWAKSGEGREWDRGKVVDENGHVDIKPAW
ncbi:predicted protein [Uncinocarpus reesii 1704]|uniref:Pre-mRNA-splicing factor 38B n=1 Tax=Uncinocarpus reesii (strain UAMH 1704) TaxID=336963 RepID=C4JE08_UNCRE|nr:uncharacterized protein UREG_00432 [Uncinocarpus reesii 1704]EEP75586.1 predicted protein [Uncinocarpus reesii 1704]